MSPHMSVEPPCSNERTRSFGCGPRMSSQQSLAPKEDMHGRAVVMVQMQPAASAPGLGRRPTPTPGGFA